MLTINLETRQFFKMGVSYTHFKVMQALTQNSLRRECGPHRACLMWAPDLAPLLSQV